MRAPPASPARGWRVAAALLLALSTGGIASQAQVAEPQPPANDGFAAAQVLDGFACVDGYCQLSLPAISTTNATLEDAEPQPCIAGATVWYRLDLAEATQVAVAAETDFPAVVSIYRGNGSSLAGLESLACAQGAFPDGGPVVSDLAVFADAGPLWLQVGGQVTEGGTGAGNLTVRISLGTEPIPPRFDLLPEAPTVRVNEKTPLLVDVEGHQLDGVAWDFGDNATGEGFAVEHRWTLAGAYEVKATGIVAPTEVILVDQAGAAPAGGPQNATTVTVVAATLTPLFEVDLLRAIEPCDCQLEVIGLPPPEGGLPDPLAVRAGQPLVFTEQAFGGRGALNFTWAFGDGATAWGGQAKHTYDAIGDYAARLTVRDGTGTVRTLERVVHVYDLLFFSGHAEPGENVTMDLAPFGSLSCLVASNGTAVDFNGYVVVARDPAGLGGGEGPLQATDILLVSFVGGPEAGQCERVTIVLSYAGLLTGTGVAEYLLVPFYWTGAAWRDLRVAPGTSVAGSDPSGDLRVVSRRLDLAGDRVILVTNHTSSYALGGVGGGGGGGASVPVAATAPVATAPADSPPADPAPAPAGDPAAAPEAGAATGSGAAAGSGGSGGAGGGGGPAELLVRRPDGSPFLTDGIPGATLAGAVEILARNAPGDGAFRYVLVGPDGAVTVLASNSSRAAWDTSAYGNGPYRVELHDGDGIVLASRSYLVYNGRTEATQAIGAVVLGAAIMAAGFLLSTLFGVVTEGAKAVGEDKFRERTKRHRITAWLARIPTVPSLLVGVPLFIVFFTIDGMQVLDWDLYVRRLPYVAAAAALVFASAYSLEILLNVASGAKSRFQLLLTGALALAGSTLLFRSAFGYPGFVEEEEVEGGLPPRVEGLRSVALLGVILALAAPFFLILLYGSFQLGETGMAIALSLLATSSLPFRPVPGANLWRWNKAASILAVAATFSLLVAFEIGAVPLVAIASAGVAGLAAFLAIYRWLRARPQAPVQDGAPADGAEAPGAAAPAPAPTA